MYMPEFIETSVDANDPESILLAKEQRALQDRALRILRRAKNPVLCAKQLGITYEMFADLVSNSLALRSQLIVRCEIESTTDDGDELRCRVNRKSSKVIITKGETS